MRKNALPMALAGISRYVINCVTDARRTTATPNGLVLNCREAPQFSKFMPTLGALFSVPVCTVVLNYLQNSRKKHQLCCAIMVVFMKKQLQTDLRSSSTSSKKSPRCTLCSLNTTTNLPVCQPKYPKLKMYKWGLLGGEANFAINTIFLLSNMQDIFYDPVNSRIGSKGQLICVTSNSMTTVLAFSKLHQMIFMVI